MRALILSISIASILIFSGKAFAKTASCPCSPCKCSPCTCGAGGSKGGKHHEKDRGKHDGGRAAVGVGANIDLGGVGHHEKEPDPFAVGGGGAPVAHTEEKKTTKKPGKGPEPVSFDKIELTGNEAKEVDNNPSEPPASGNTVSDNEVKTNDSPAPEPKENPKAKKPKPTWPKPIQDWLDARAAISTAKSNLSNAQGAYYTELYKFYGKSAYHDKLQSAVHEACDKVTKAGEAIVGDLLMGGYLGGWLRRHRPGVHYFAEDLTEVRDSIRKVLALRPMRIFPAHGGPLDPAEVERWLSTLRMQCGR